MKENNEDFFGCPKCNCRIVYQLDLARVPIGIMDRDNNGDMYLRDVSRDGQLHSSIYKCADCGFEFDEPLLISAECYEGQ